MGLRKLIVASVVAVAASTSGAWAADLGFKGSVKDDGAYVPSVAAADARWYVRIDGSFAAYDTPVLVEQGVDTLTEPDIANQRSLGFGVGAYFTPRLRGELTYERRFETDVEGTLDHPQAQLPGVREFGLESDLFLANFYYDFGDRKRFNPYIGAGLGFVRHTTSDGVVNSCDCAIGIVEGNETYHVAAAFLAGAALHIGRGFHIDAGYRFLYLGETETGPVTITERAGQPAGSVEISDDPTVEQLHAHEFRIGLRYDIR